MGQISTWIGACGVTLGSLVLAGHASAEDQNGVEMRDGCRVIHQGDHSGGGANDMSGSQIGSRVTAGNGTVSGSTTLPGQPQTSVTAGNGQVTTSNSGNGQSVTVTNRGNDSSTSTSSSTYSTSGSGGVTVTTSSDGDCVITTH
ncbi:hypothetical protein [Jiella sp. M17.18]|uniref:hypothetical protein n=1 Tax=Jiella sp. M17.18 TaxID=3234247 RepID=UPI0034DEF05C